MPRLAPVSWKTAGGSFPRAPCPGPGPQRRLTRVNEAWPKREEVLQGKKVEQGSKKERKGGMYPLGNHSSWVRWGVALPLSKDLFFSQHGWGPEKSTKKLGPPASSVRLTLWAALRVRRKIRLHPCLWEPTDRLSHTSGWGLETFSESWRWGRLLKSKGKHDVGSHLYKAPKRLPSSVVSEVREEMVVTGRNFRGLWGIDLGLITQVCSDFEN